jgi:hypothetical protein
MPRARTDRTAVMAFDAITVEGALIAPAMLARIAQHQAGGQTEADYRVPKGLTLRDEIARFFRIGQAMFKELMASETPSTAATANFIEKTLRDVFGFDEIRRVGTRMVGDRHFTITLEGLGGRVPVVVVPPADDLDRPSMQLTTDGRRRSAASALQDWLNADQGALWGLCTNGVRLRLTRDNASLTRPAFVEADLRRIFEVDLFADFAALWLLAHASRFGLAGALPADSVLERWRDAGQKEGVAARDKLRDGVEAALLSLGTGFLSHTENATLQERLSTDALRLPEFFGQLLRLVYRLIFLLAAEDRNLLHAPDASATARKLYAEGYSVGALRDRAVRRAAWDRHHDLWEGLLITFAALARGEPRLGLPALGGLFTRGSIPDLETAKLANRSLMEAIYRLAWLKEDSGLVPVNWRDMETEELGSVYESLLELTPRLNGGGRRLIFAEGGEAEGHARKTTGSYYTPDSLVQTLLDSALDPVLDRVEAEADDPATALLSVAVLEPACGSGHFLIAAARRIATRLARARAGGVASPADFRHALRDVARTCIHGVDRNPMAVELTKVALWIETVEPGKPLGFLDANIRCGDALLGVFDLTTLAQGIPDAAYRPLAGDDKEAAKIAGRVNREQREAAAQHDFAMAQGTAALVRAAQAVAEMPEDDLAGVQARARAYEAVHAERDWWATKTACDLYVAAFLAPKHFRSGALVRAQTPDHVPTTLDVRTALAGRQPDSQLVAKAVELSGSARAFHWPLEFPAAVAAGGFDVVLGNPPWERIKLHEREFFASYAPEIAEAPNAATRGRLIEALKNAVPGTRDRRLYEEFETAKRSAEASSIIARECGRFPLTGIGDINTYGLFAELFKSVLSKRGRAGLIAPTELLTGDSLKSFFQDIVQRGVLKSSIAFENEEFIFPGIANVNRFALITLGPPNPKQDQFRFAFYLRRPEHLFDEERFFSLSKSDFQLLNPNTKTCPVFRTKTDAALTKKVCAHVPVMIDSTHVNSGNPWGASFLSMFHMSNDSNIFRTGQQLRGAGFERDRQDWIQRRERYLPLYEAKFIWHFDHRFSSYHNLGKVKGRGGRGLPPVTQEEYLDPNFEPEPRYWVSEEEVRARLTAAGWQYNWLVGWRDISSAKLERTVVATAFPRVGVGNSLSLMIFNEMADVRKIAALVGSLASLACDYFARHKVGGTHLNYFVYQQLPILPPETYPEGSLSFIVPRVLELIYTSNSMASFARDLGYDGSPFTWDEDRRAQLRAELDAWYARAYGLTRDELRYILDPADVKGADFPSETFRVLKANDISRFGPPAGQTPSGMGTYRTARLVLQAWDRLERGELAA